MEQDLLYESLAKALWIALQPWSARESAALFLLPPALARASDLEDAREVAFARRRLVATEAKLVLPPDENAKVNVNLLNS